MSRKDVAVLDLSECHDLSLGERLLVCRHLLRLPVEEIARRTGLSPAAYRDLECDVAGDADARWLRLLARVPILQPIFGVARVPFNLIYAAGPLREAIRAMAALDRDMRVIELSRIRLEVEWWDQAAQSA
jgi:transcriptional regulator with XRE-family HTH domain